VEVRVLSTAPTTPECASYGSLPLGCGRHAPAYLAVNYPPGKVANRFAAK